MTLLQRFEKKYIPEPNSGCWLWFGAQHRQGYGQLGIAGSTVTAHRTSWQLYRGDIPSGMRVLHKCDITCCVNPDHLFLGTQSDNMFDCGKKGRSNKKGAINGNAKLDEEAVRFIRRAKPYRGYLNDLAKRFGVRRLSVATLRTKPYRHWKGIE